MAYIPGQHKAAAFKEHFYHFLFIILESVGVLDGNPYIRAANPLFAQCTKVQKAFPVKFKIPFVHLDLAVRQRYKDAVVDVHIDRERLRCIAVFVAKIQELLCHSYCPPHCFQVCSANKRVEVGNIQPLVEVYCIVDSCLVCRRGKKFRPFNRINLVFWEIHV